MIKSYSELSRLSSLRERFDYLKMGGRVGEDTFGFSRWLNQVFYKSGEWRHIRREIIVRDDGCELGLRDFPIHGLIYVHHINPINEADIERRSPRLLDPENLICVSGKMHEALHYANVTDEWFKNQFLGSYELVERKPNDTIPWAQQERI